MMSTTPQGPLERFLRARARSPEAPAVVYAGRTWTYDDVGTAVDLIAGGLIETGVREERPVAVMVDRSEWIPILALAVMRSGGVYVPVSLNHPPKRRLEILATSGAAVLLTQTAVDTATATSVPTVSVADLLRLRRPVSARSPAPRSACYVIFTSGTTGTAKGVVVERRSLDAFVSETIRLYELGPDDRVLQFSDVGFDVSLLEIMCTLSVGGTLYVASDEHRRDPTELTRLLFEAALTVADIPVGVLPFLDPRAAPSLRLLSVGSEVVPPALVRRWLMADRRVVNSYGPTEATIAICTHECDLRPSGNVPIGRPLPGQSAYVLDEGLEPMPGGEPGELYVGGSQLARGYLAQPRETADRFIPNPFASNGERLYRTGDRARWNEYGDLEFLGRLDRQIKLRGVRVELEEIESAVRSLEGVSYAAVLFQAQRLTAFAVPDRGAEITGEGLLRRLADVLPGTTLPHRIRIVTQIPTTGNGKVDVAALGRLADAADLELEPPWP